MEKVEGNRAQEVVSQTPPMRDLKSKKIRKVRKSRSIIARTSQWVVDNQLGISIAFFLALMGTHYLAPQLRWRIEKFHSLQYYSKATERYGIGRDDVFFVIKWIMVITGTRVTFMNHVFAPFARQVSIKGRKDQIRFAEQGWMFAYYVASWGLGFYIWYNSEYWLNMKAMWEGWPDRETDGLMKWYYLVQLSFWLQQLFVVNIEERRKDHWQMFTHHIVTCLLVFSSYVYHNTKVGNVILVLMDTSDYVLSLAKMLRYVGLQFACDCTFGVFIISWLISRHVFFNLVWWSIYKDHPAIIDYGCYTGNNGNLTGPFVPPNGFAYLLEPFKDPGGMVCSTENMVLWFLILLGFLQVLLVVWFGQIARLAWKVLSGGNADDPRSDDEEEEEVELESQSPSSTYGHKKEYFLEEEVGVEQMHFKSTSITRSKGSGRSSGVQLPVKKELLNRVGCDTKMSKPG